IPMLELLPETVTEVPFSIAVEPDVPASTPMLLSPVAFTRTDPAAMLTAAPAVALTPKLPPPGPLTVTAGSTNVAFDPEIFAHTPEEFPPEPSTVTAVPFKLAVP